MYMATHIINIEVIINPNTFNKLTSNLFVLPWTKSIFSSSSSLDKISFNKLRLFSGIKMKEKN